MASGKSKIWLYTLNNPKVELREIWDENKMDYMVGQLEQGEEGTPHLQFFIKWKTHKRFKEAAIPGAHWEAAKKAEAAIAYCQKDDKTRRAGPWEFGKKPFRKGGDRKSFTARELLNKTDEELLDLTPYQALQGKKIQHVFQKMSYQIEPKDHSIPKKRHHWICGPPNSGKSYILEHLPEPKFEIPYNDDWSGYQG